jgi:hypothetical protein
MAKLDLPVELVKDGVDYPRTASTATDYWNLVGSGWTVAGLDNAEPVEVEVASNEPKKDQKPVKVKVGGPAESQAGDSTPATPAGSAG